MCIRDRINPIELKIWNNGTIRRIPENMYTTNVTLCICLFPKKFNFAKLYPPRLHIITDATAVINAMSKLFDKYLKNGNTIGFTISLK